MKNRNKFSKRTMALMVAAGLLLAGGTVSGTRAALNIQSDLYVAQFYLNDLQVHLIENGADVCERAGHVNNLDGTGKTTGELATELGYSHPYGGEEQLGSFEPGMLYKEEISARNGRDVDQFVRLTVRKYWMEPQEDSDGNTTMVKSSRLSPDRIHLYYGKNYSETGDTYNTSAWTENTAERTAESRTYYYKTALDGGEDTALLFDQLMVDAKIVDLGKVTETTEGSKTIYTYEYQYDGSVFYIEADVQAIQTHNINDAIKSQWGVNNVTGSYNDASGSGTLSVN